MNHVPPPTLPVTAVSPCQAGGAATPSWPFGMFSDCGLLKIAPAYQAGPGMKTTLPVYFLTNSGVKTLTLGVVPFLMRASSMAATRLHSVVSVSTVMVLGP